MLTLVLSIFRNESTPNGDTGLLPSGHSVIHFINKYTVIHTTSCYFVVLPEQSPLNPTIEYRVSWCTPSVRSQTPYGTTKTRRPPQTLFVPFSRSTLVRILKVRSVTPILSLTTLSSPTLEKSWWVVGRSCYCTSTFSGSSKSASLRP